MSWDRPLLTQKLEFGEKLLLLEMNGLSMRQGERGNKRALLPTERQAVPTTEPDWD